jgi:transmembrane sensor
MRPVRVTTAPGEQATITLPDGSSVELNGATALAYPRGFGALPFVGPEARRVRLTGEAFFSVRSASRPFVVKTPDARVEVLGTQFTVETRAVEKGERAPEAGASKAGASKAGATGAGDGSLTRVALRSGRVRFSAAGGSEGAVTLSKPGHVSHLTSARATPTPPETTDLTYLEAWRHGGFAVREASLPETLRKLERRFGASLRLDADSMAARPLTLLYARNASLEQVLKDICLVQGLTFRASSQGYVLTRP